jgi:hypothetical protein
MLDQTRCLLPKKQHTSGPVSEATDLCQAVTAMVIPLASRFGKCDNGWGQGAIARLAGHFNGVSGWRVGKGVLRVLGATVIGI